MPHWTPALSLAGLCLLLPMATSYAATDLATFRVTVQPVARTVSLAGTVEAIKSATVSAQTSGRIVKLYVDVNDSVAAGAPLLEITSKEQGAELATAEANFAKAQALNIEAQQTFARYQTLFPQGAISKGAMDQAVANAKSSQQAASAAAAQVNKARESLTYTLVSAPYAGVVTARHVEEGETVSPGQALLSGYANNGMRAVFQLPQLYRQALQSINEVTVSLANGQQYTVAAPEIFNFVDPSSLTTTVRLPLPSNLPMPLPGSWLTVSFVVANDDVVLIPATALYQVNELTGVYLQRGNNFVLQQIRLGLAQGEQLQVLAGLQSGDVIAADAYQVLLHQPEKELR